MPTLRSVLLFCFLLVLLEPTGHAEWTQTNGPPGGIIKPRKYKQTYLKQP